MCYKSQHIQDRNDYFAFIFEFLENNADKLHKLNTKNYNHIV